MQECSVNRNGAAPMAMPQLACAACVPMRSEADVMLVVRKRHIHSIRQANTVINTISVVAVESLDHHHLAQAGVTDGRHLGAGRVVPLNSVAFNLEWDLANLLHPRLLPVSRFHHVARMPVGHKVVWNQMRKLNWQTASGRTAVDAELQLIALRRAQCYLSDDGVIFHREGARRRIVEGVRHGDRARHSGSSVDSPGHQYHQDDTGTDGGSAAPSEKSDPSCYSGSALDPVPYNSERTASDQPWPHGESDHDTESELAQQDDNLLVALLNDRFAVDRSTVHESKYVGPLSILVAEVALVIERQGLCHGFSCLYARGLVDFRFDFDSGNECSLPSRRAGGTAVGDHLARRLRH
eukprot:7391827-Prymnesium_polylepis.1